MTAHDLGDKSISVGDEISIGMSPFKYHIFLSKVNHFNVLIINFYLTNLVWISDWIKLDCSAFITTAIFSFILLMKTSDSPYRIELVGGFIHYTYKIKYDHERLRHPQHRDLQ